MKRDLDLIRLILLEAEERLPAEQDIERFNIPSYDDDAVRYHTMLLFDGGYLKGFSSADTETHTLEYITERLTATGHDYLDQIRDTAVWEKTKEVAQAAGGFSLEILGNIAKGIIATQVEKYSGVKIDV